MKKLANFFRNNGLKMVANLATGGVGGVVTGAVEEILSSAGITRFDNEDEIISYLKDDKEMMQQFKELELKETQMYLEDVKSARLREMQVADSENATWLNKNINSIMALVFMMVYFGLTAYVIIKQIDSTALNEVKTLFAMVVSYYFGAMKMKGGS